MSFNDNPLINLPVELACLVKLSVNFFVFMPDALSVSFTYLLIVWFSMGLCLQ